MDTKIRALGERPDGVHTCVVGLNPDQLRRLQLWWDTWVEPHLFAVVNATMPRDYESWDNGASERGRRRLAELREP